MLPFELPGALEHTCPLHIDPDFSITSITKPTKDISFVNLNTEIPILHANKVIFSNLSIFRERTCIHSSLDCASLRHFIQVFVIFNSLFASCALMNDYISLSKVNVDHFSQLKHLDP